MLFLGVFIAVVAGPEPNAFTEMVGGPRTGRCDCGFLREFPPHSGCRALSRQSELDWHQLF